MQDGRGFTALAGAAFDGHAGIITLLLSAGADSNQKNKDGQTALDIAIKNNKIEAANLLRAASAQ